MKKRRGRAPYPDASLIVHLLIWNPRALKIPLSAACPRWGQRRPTPDEQGPYTTRLGHANRLRIAFSLVKDEQVPCTVVRLAD